MGVFLNLYDHHDGAYEKIFSEVGRSKGGRGKKLKLALSEETTGWQVLSMLDWEVLEVGG